jgi:hypothetical protein
MNAVTSPTADKSIPVQVIPRQFSAFRLPTQAGANRQALSYLKDDVGLNCAINNEGLVFFSKTVDIMSPGEIVIHDGDQFVEIVTEEVFASKYWNVDTDDAAG